MTAYPYTRRDLLAQPEFYEYAACGPLEFFVGWTADRDKAIETFKRRAAAGASAQSKPEVSGEPLRQILQGLLARLGAAPAASDKREFDLFVMKYEVHRRLFDAYSADRTRDPSSAPAAVGDYLAYGAVLAAYAERLDSAKYLSVLLKICDMLCSLPIERFSSDDARDAAALLANERRLVRLWETRAAA